jgi:arylsulfatase A-like enzyme/Tfp pilus assembly protein PilF
LARPVRYTFILILVALGTCLAAVGGWRYARASAPVNGPIVLISVDGLRPDRLPAYGFHDIETPAIDALAADGVVFDRVYAHVPQTLPSHATLLTGRLPFETGVRDGVGFVLPAGERTVAEMLRDRGYATGAVVSSFLLRKATGINQGFMFFDDDLPADEENGKALLQRSGAAAEEIAEHWFDSIGTDRAFLFLHLSDLDRPRDADSAAPRSYDARSVDADLAIGRLVKYLKAHQLYDRTTILLVADHGEGLGEHGESGHGLLISEDTLRVPLIVKQPSGEGHGLRVKAMAQLADIVPTILDLAKAPMPGNLRGRTLTPLLKGGQREAVPVYSESLFARYHFGWSELSSVTDGRYRFIKAPHEELYDLDHDAAAHDNVIDAHPKIAATLRAALKDFAAGPAPTPAVVSADERAALEAFGYVGQFDGPISTTALEDPKEHADIVERYRQAVDAVVAGDLNGAIDRFRALVRDEPERVDLWLHLAAAATDDERMDVAAEAFKQATRLTPEAAEASLGAADALIRLRKLDEARHYAQQAIDTPRVAPDAASEGHELLARIALARRDADAARDEAAAAEQADARRPIGAYIEGRIALDRRRYDEAFTAFEPILATVDGPGRPLADVRVLAAEALVGLDRYSEAEYLLLEQLKSQPRSTRARSLLATVYRDTGRTEEAKSLAAH